MKPLALNFLSCHGSLVIGLCDSCRISYKDDNDAEKYGLPFHW